MPMRRAAVIMRRRRLLPPTAPTRQAAFHTASSSSGTPAPVTAGDPEEGQLRAPWRVRASSCTRRSSSTAHRSCSRRRSAAWRPAPAGTARARGAGVEIVDRIASARARHVDHVHQHLRALEMAQELVAEPEAAMRAFDQAGHVGDDEAAVVAQPDDAEIRRQRRERVVGDLRTGRRDARDQRRLAGVREIPPARRRRAASARGADPSLRPARPAAPCAARGWSELAKRALPMPPRPPRATSTRWPSSARSASSRGGSSGSSGLLVDERADRHRAARGPRRCWPVRFEPWPCSPRSAVNSGWKR